MERYMYVIVAADGSTHYGFTWSQETAIAEANRLEEKLSKKVNIFEIDLRMHEIEEEAGYGD